MRAYSHSSEGVPSDRLEIRAQRATAVEVEIVIRPTRCSPASTQVQRHLIRRATLHRFRAKAHQAWDDATVAA